MNNSLLLSCEVWMHLADINEHAVTRYKVIIVQMKVAENVNEEFKRSNQIAWVRAMNSISNRAEEIVRSEIVYI